MAYLFKGALSFPTLFKAETLQGMPDSKPRYSCSLMFPPNDPQIAAINQIINEQLATCFPNGFPPRGNMCWMEYKQKYGHKDYYDAKFDGWMVLSATKGEEQGKPATVDASAANNPVMDRGEFYAGRTVLMSCDITGYTKGDGGIGCWLNGVKLTDEESLTGRLDGGISVDQMFASAGNMTNMAAASSAPSAPIPTPPGNAPVAPSMPQQPTPAPAPAPAPAAPAPAPAAPVQQGLTMTAAANGVTYQAYKDAGWTDEQMIEQGVALPPGGAALAFTQ